MEFSDLFKIDGLDLTGEYAHTNSVWYIHGIYTSGYNYKGNILGHHVGGDGEDLFLRLEKDFKEWSDRFERVKIGGQFDYGASGLSQATPERKYEIGFDSSLQLSDSSRMKLLYEYEAYRGFENVSGQKAQNHIFELQGSIKF